MSSVKLDDLEFEYTPLHMGCDCCGGDLPCNHQWSPHQIIKSWDLPGFPRIYRPHELVDKRRATLLFHLGDPDEPTDVWNAIEFGQTVLLPHAIGECPVEGRIVAIIYDSIVEHDYGEREVHLTKPKPERGYREYQLGFAGTLDLRKFRVEIVTTHTNRP